MKRQRFSIHKLKHIATLDNTTYILMNNLNLDRKYRSSVNYAELNYARIMQKLTEKSIAISFRIFDHVSRKLWSTNQEGNDEIENHMIDIVL